MVPLRVFLDVSFPFTYFLNQSFRLSCRCRLRMVGNGPAGFEQRLPESCP